MASPIKYFEHTLTLSPDSVPANKPFSARLAYQTHGSPSNPAILMPTCYGGKIADTSPFLYAPQPNSPIPPPLPVEKYFIIVVGLLGGGESSSPSTQPPPWNGPAFPKTTYTDNINLQHALCTSLGIKRVHAYIGFSMGGQQAYHMATLYPEYVENFIAIATSARTSMHNWTFLEGPRNALVHSVDFAGGEYKGQAEKGLRAFGRVYAPWALSPAWFKGECWKEAGFETLEGYLEEGWSGKGMDANDNLAMLWTWQQGDISKSGPALGGAGGGGEGLGFERGDFVAALGSIRARALIMPARTDQYFPPEDNVEEVKHLRKGEFSCIETVWGHVAGGGSGTKEDTEFIKSEVKRFLNA